MMRQMELGDLVQDQPPCKCGCGCWIIDGCPYERKAWLLCIKGVGTRPLPADIEMIWDESIRPEDAPWL